MRKIYIVLTHTGTVLSKVIKGFTKDEFTHSSISLDVELNQMYSFGRLNPYNPFIGGFVHEHKNKGTYKRFYNTKTKIYSLNVTEEQYENIVNNIRKIENNKDNYKFNILGLIGAGFNKKIRKEKSFYCAEFVRYLLDESKIFTGLPNAVKPEDFKNIKGIKEIYDGLLRKYNIPNLDVRQMIENHILLQKENKSVI